MSGTRRGDSGRIGIMKSSIQGGSSSRRGESCGSCFCRNGGQGGVGGVRDLIVSLAKLLLEILLTPGSKRSEARGNILSKDLNLVHDTGLVVDYMESVRDEAVEGGGVDWGGGVADQGGSDEGYRLLMTGGRKGKC